MSSTDAHIHEALPTFALASSGRILILSASGAWTLEHISELDTQLSEAIDPLDYDQVVYDLKHVSRLDTAGAYILARAIRCNPEQCYPWKIENDGGGASALIDTAANAIRGRPPAAHDVWYDVIANLGKGVVRAAHELTESLAFLGHFFVVLMKLCLTPYKIRWKSVVALIEDVGLNAAPIVMLLSFFLGAVIAYMGASLLATMGLKIFMVDLVGYSMLRELAVIITAILLAGRSASSFTAKIGAMKMRQEIDAMTVIGLETFETLVVPRALACLVALPILTLLAMLSGVAGGIIVAWIGPTDISPIRFVIRLQEVIDINHFWVGMVKAPFFALIIAIIGCRQGLAVTGSVDSLGTRTTTSVVQAIFSVIAVDVIFAVLFFEMGI